MTTTLDEELDVYGSYFLVASHLNRVENAQDRISEIVEWFASNETVLHVWLDEGPVDEDLGRQFSHAIVSNPRITDIGFHPNRGVDIRDLIAWIAGRKTLIHMTNLQSMLFSDIGGMSEQDCDLLFSLLLTSASLKRVAVILKRDTREDPFIAAFCHYLSGTTFLKNLTLHDT